ncbi:aspartokinase [Dothidotthia symphoricarpi CBS 119687]|uniref:Aspartokinase n=1 Tax=Dothidotthia symphoricarpi CBS 119687 TaxID=1392245 RepID=A0A6A6A4T0_9PLEO|nr:aspartokinase [Dothidotthia symphoricarpi CBS 119687]KAF2126175.1 aspartokinase [Dothidotthia symphoricarpi CBS 119687]
MTIDQIGAPWSGTGTWVVQKFGGTSIGKYPLNVVENVVKPITRYHRVVVVCSALSASTKKEGTTNRLLQAYKHCLGTDFERSNTLVQNIRAEHISSAYDYIKDPELVIELVQQVEHECEQVIQLLLATKTIGHGNSYILDKVISTGERLACFFLSATLRDRGIASEIVDFSEIVPTTINSMMNQSFYDSLSDVMAKRIRRCKATVPVVTGFFGPIDRGLLTQVGRGYTDFCASMISVGLRAHELQVWKEVEGIFTADPSKVPSAQMLPVISSEEASELTFHGSEVIHYAAMRLAMRASISMRIKNVLNPQSPGTLIVDDWKGVSPSPVSSTSMNCAAIRTSLPCTHDGATRTPIAITSKDKILLINIRSAERLKAHSFLAGIFSVFDKRNLSIDLICTSEVQVSMALHSEVSLITGDDEDDYSEPVRQNLQNAIAQLQEYGDVELLHEKTIISLVGKQLRRALSVTGQMFSTLSENRIKIEMIAHGASENSISCVVQEQDSVRAVALLHAVFFTTPQTQPSSAILKPNMEVQLQIQAPASESRF